MKKTEKVLFVENLTEELKSAKSVVLINFTGMDVKAQQDLKRRLKEVGAKMIVVKNTLLRLAGKTAKIDAKILEDTVLSGQTALIIAGGDTIAPIQILGQFAKEFDSKAGYSTPQMKVGIVDGLFQSGEALVKLSSLPNRDALLGQLLGTLMSNLSGLVGTLQNPAQQLVYTLNAKIKN